MDTQEDRQAGMGTLTTIPDYLWFYYLPVHLTLRPPRPKHAAACARSTTYVILTVTLFADYTLRYWL